MSVVLETVQNSSMDLQLCQVCCLPPGNRRAATPTCTLCYRSTCSARSPAASFGETSDASLGTHREEGGCLTLRTQSWEGRGCLSLKPHARSSQAGACAFKLGLQWLAAATSSSRCQGTQPHALTTAREGSGRRSSLCRQSTSLFQVLVYLAARLGKSLMRENISFLSCYPPSRQLISALRQPVAVLQCCCESLAAKR